MRSIVLAVWITGSLALALGVSGCRDAPAESKVAGVESQAGTGPDRGKPDAVVEDAAAMVRDGRRIFRFDTFGDEAFWTDVCGCTSRSRR